MMKRDQSKKQPKTVSSPNSNAASNKSTVTSTTNTTTTLLSPSKTAPPSATATSTTASSTTQKPAAASGKPTPSSPAKPEAVSANDAFQKAFLNLSKSDQKRTVKDIKNTANLLSFFQDKQINILQLANSFGLNVDKQSENASGKMPKNKGNPQSTSDESCSFLNLYLEASKKASENNEKIKILINQQSGDKQPHSSSDDDEEIDCLDDEYLEDDDEEDELSELDAQWEAALLDPRQHSKIVQQSQIIASINKIRSEEDKTVSDTNLLLLASTSGIYELAHCVLSPSSDGSQPPPQHSIKLLNRCLLHACAAGHAEIAKLLLEKGAEADFQTLPRKNISLHFAALHGHLNVIKLLVKHVQDRHAQDSRQISCSQFIEMANQDGHTALIHSASANHVDCAQYLIAEHNASIRCPPSAEFKDSALSLACYKGNYEMVKFLLELDNGQAFSKQELTDALLETSVEGHVDIAKLLIDKGATVITPKDSFESCLNLAAGGNHIELACLLLSKGADIEEANDEGYTPLQCSVKEMHMEMVALLLSKNADINCLNKNTKETALTLACSLNSTEIVDFLIRAGADLDLGGQTPLQVCAATGNTELAKHLLECGADINLGDPTPLQISVANENVELAKHLLECGADINLGTQTPLTAAAANGNMEMVKYLVECGADVNLGQQTALSACVTNMELAKYLIECGADINLGTPTPLQACASYGNLELAKWLVERGAEVQFGDPTPLQVCASYGYLELAKWLIECGADVNARSMTGQTALHYAFKHPQMVKLLALNGADIEAETEDGLTCLQIAIRNKNLSTIQVLVECGANIREPAVKSRKRSKNSSSSSSKSLNQSKAMKEIDPIHQKIHEQHMWLVNGEAHQFDLLEASSQRPVLCDKHANDQILPNTTRLSQTSNCSDDLDFAHGYGPQALEKITQYLQEQAALSGADSFPPPPPHSPSGKKSDGHSAKDDQFFNGINLNSMENDWLNYLSSYDREQLHQRQQQLAEKLDVQLDASNSLESRAESDKIFKEVVLRMVSERSHGGEHNDYLAVNYAADEKLSPSDIFRRKPYPLVGCNAEYLKEAERFERCISHMNASEEEQIKLKQKILLEDLHRVEKKLQDRTQATFSCGHPNLNHPNQKLIRSLCALQNQAKPKREAEKQQGDNPANPQQTAANQAKLDSLSYSLKKGLYKLISSSNPKDASANCLLDNATNSATDHPDSTDSTLFNNLECLDKELSDVEFLESSKKCESQQNLTSGQEKEGENAEEEPASDGEEDVKVKASKKMNRKLENLLRKPNCNLKADLSKMLSTLSPEYQPVTLAKIAEEIKKMQADISSQQGAEQCELSGEDQQPVENEESANDEELSDLFDKFEGSQIKMLKELSKLNIDYPLLAKILSEPSTSDLQSNDSQDNRAILIEETEEEDELDEEECLDEESELENSDSEDSSYSNEGDDDEEDDEEDDGEEEDDDPDEDEYYVEERLSGDHIVHERRVFNLNYPIIKEMLKDSQNLLNLRSANLERQSSSSDEHSDQEKRKKIEEDPAAEQASGEQAHTCDGSSKHAHFKLLDTPEMSADIMNYIKKKQIAESRNSAAAAKAGAPTCNHVHQPGGKCVVSVSQSYVRKKPAGGTEQVTCEHHHGGGGGEDRDAKIESLCNRVISREYNELCNELKMKYSGNSSGASAAASNSKQAAFASFDSISKDDVESWKMFEQIMKFNKIKNENPENKEKINEINHWFHEVSKDPLLLTKLERISGAKRAADPQNKENAASPMNESQTSLLVVENEGKGNLKLTSKAKKLIKSTMKNSKLLNSNSSQPANNSSSSSSVRIQSTTINNPHLNSSNPQSLKNHVRNIMKAKRTLNQTTITEERHTQVTISSHASGNSCSKLDLKLLEEALPPEKYNHLLNQLNNYSCFGNPQAKTQSSAAASKSTTAAAVAAASAVAGKLQQANIARNPTNAKHDEKLANSDKNHDSALIIACEHGSVELLNAVLTHGSKEAIDHRDRKGFTGLHHAAQRGYLEIMDILVKHGADIDAEDKQNNTPLLIAATYGQVEAVQKLIGWGSKPTKQDKKHQSILHCASKNNKSEVIKYLLNNCPVNDLGLDVKDKKHQTALHFAVINSDLEVVNKLIECGASIAIKDKSERTVFHWSALKGSADILERLLQNKDSVDLNCRDVEGKSALHLASEFGHKECCSMLLKNGADLYSNDNEGRTALHLAVMNNHHTTLEVLLEKGAPINAVSGRQQTPLHIACEMGYTASARVLLRNKADFMAPEKATGKTPLFIAASGGHVEIGKLLIEISKGMDINSQPVLASKDTALTISADKGHCKFVQLLIDNGAQLDVKNKRGNTALWLGCNSGHLDVVQALIEAGAEVDSQDNRKVSCIMAAFRRGHVKVVKWLVKYITQIPSDNEMLRYISTLDDEEMIKRCRACMDVINDEKSKQAAQANNVAKTLLDELNFEKEQEEAKKMGKKLAASKKRERKKLKRKECKVEEEPPTNDKKKNKQKQSKSATPPPPPPPPVEPPAEPEKREEEEDEQDNEIDRVEMPEIAEVKKSSKNKKNEKEQQKNAEKAKEPVASAKEAEPSKKSNAGKNEAKATKDKKKREPEPTTNRTGKNADKADKTDRNEKRENDKANKKSSSKNEDSQPSASSKTAEQPSEKAVASGTKNLSLPANAGNSQSPSSSAESGSDKEKGRTPAAIAPKQQKEDDWKEVVRRQKKINVPANAISRVIGRGGCNIKLVREISGAYIDIENQRNSQGEIIKTGGDRQIIIKGSNEATKTAYQLIQSFVNEPEKDTDAILTQLGLPKPILPSAGESSKATSGVSAKANLLAANPASSRQSTSAVGANNGACKTSPIGSRDQHQQPKYQQLASEPAFSKSNNSSLNSSRKNSSGTSYDAPHEEANSSQKSSICNVSSSAEKSNDSISSRPNNKSELMVSTASPAANEPPPNPTSMSREPGYFSPFDSILGKVAQETIWSTKETKLNFASVAAAGLNASSSASTASNNSNSSLNNKKTKEIQVDISKAPGYRNVNLSPNYTPSVSYQSHGPTTSAVGSTASTSTLNQIMANNFGPIGAIGAKSAPCTPPLSSVTIKPPSFTSQHSAIQPAGVQQASLTSAFSSSLNSARSVQKILGSPTKPFGSSASSASVASAFAQPPPFSTSSSSAYHPTKNFTAASSFSGSSRVFHDSTSNLLSNSDLSGDPLFNAMNTSTNSSSLNPAMQLANPTSYQQSSSQSSSSFLPMQSTASFIGQPPQQQATISSLSSPQQQAATQPLASNLQLQMRAALLAAGAQLQAARIQQTNPFIPKPPQLSNLNPPDQSTDKMRMLQQMQQQYQMSYLRGQPQGGQQSQFSAQASTSANPIGSRLGSNVQLPKLSNQQQLPSMSKLPVASNFSPNSSKFVAPFHQQSSTSLNTQNQLSSFAAGSQPSLQLNNPAQMLSSSQQQQQQLQQLFANASKLGEQQYAGETSGTAVSEEKRLPRPIGTERAQRKLLPETFDLGSSFNQWPSDHQDDWSNANSPSLSQFNSPNTLQLLNYENNLFNGLTNPSLLTGDTTTPDDYWSSSDTNSSTNKLSGWQD